MPKFCPNCGSELQFQEANVCPKCNVKINEPPSAKGNNNKLEIALGIICGFFGAGFIYNLLIVGSTTDPNALTWRAIMFIIALISGLLLLIVRSKR